MNSTRSLEARLGLYTAIMLVMGSLIGSGIFKKAAPMTSKLQSEYLVLTCWVIAGVITLLGALSYAEVASRLAQTGGLYAYLKAIYGEWTAYLFGWGCFAVIQSASIASIAFVFAEALLSIFPASFAGGKEANVVAILTVLSLSAVNYVGVVYGALVTNVFTTLKILGIGVVVILAFSAGHGISLDAAQANILPVVPEGASLIPLMFGAMLSAFWAYDGINNIGFVGGEVKNAQRTIPLALIIGVSGVMAIYLLVNFSYFSALSVSEILHISQMKGAIFAIEMINRISGETWALFVCILILVSTFGTTNGSILSSSRIYYAMAKDGLFFSALGKAHPRFHTPALAIVVQAIWSSLLIAFSDFDSLTDMVIVVSFIFYGLGAAGIFFLRRQGVGESKNTVRVPAIIPAVYVLFCATLVLVNLYQTPVEAFSGVSLVALGIPIFWLRRFLTGS